MKLAAVSKKTDFICIHTGKHIAVFTAGSFFVSFIGIFVDQLHIAKTVHQEADLCFLHFFLLVNSFLCVFNGGAPLCTVFLFNGIQLFYDHFCHRIIMIQNILIKSNIFHGLLILCLKSLDFQTDQLVKAHIQNGCGLLFCKLKFFCRFFTCLCLKADTFSNSLHKTFLYLFPVFAAAEDFNDQVDHVAGLDKPLLDLLFFQLSAQKSIILSRCHLKEKIHMMLDHLLQAEGFRSSVCNCQHIYAKGILQPGLFIKHIGKIFYIRILFQLQDNTDSLLGGLVGNIHNVRCFFRFHKRSHIVQKLADVCAKHGIRNLCDHKLLFTAFQLLSCDPASDPQLTGSCLINFFQIILVDHNSSCRKIRSFNITHQTSDTDLIVFHICLDCIDHLSQVMRRNTGCHTYCNSFCAIYKKIWNFNRKNRRFFFCLIKVRYKIHHIFIQIIQKNLLGKLFQPGLRIPHSRSAVAFNGTEVSMAVHKSFSFFKLLGHHNKCLINRAVAMRVVFTHGIAYDTGAFTVRPVVTDSQLIHVIQRSSLHRLQPVSHIRKSTRNNDAHGIVNI